MSLASLQDSLLLQLSIQHSAQPSCISSFRPHYLGFCCVVYLES